MEPLSVLLAREKQEASDRFDRAPFAPDQAAHIVRSNADFKSHVLVIAAFVHLDQVG